MLGSGCILLSCADVLRLVFEVWRSFVLLAVFSVACASRMLEFVWICGFNFTPL